MIVYLELNQMKIALIVPNLMCSTTFLQPPVEFYILAQKLRKEHNVLVLDLRTDNLDYLSAIKRVPQDIDLCIVTTSPYDMVQMYHSDYRLKYALEFVNELKRRRFSSEIAVCGVHATLMPDWVLQNCSADFLMLWEIDVVAELAVGAIKNKNGLESVPNLVLRKNNKIIKTRFDKKIAHPELKETSPAWDLVDFTKYFGYKLEAGHYTRLNKWGVIFGSRGCPFKCSFCFNMWGNKVRFRRPESIFEEYLELEKEKLNCIFFLDANFTLNRSWALKICKLLSEQNKRIPWICQTRCDLIDEELLEEMKKAGCVSIQFGVESLNKTVLKRLNKQTNPKVIRNAVRMTRNKGITPSVFLMTGTPFDSEESHQETIEFLKKQEIPFIPIIYTPRFGSPLGDKVCSQNKADDWVKMLNLRGTLSKQRKLTSIIKQHAVLRGQSFRSTSVDFKQPNLSDGMSGRRLRFEQMTKLSNKDSIEKFLLRPEEKPASFVSFPITDSCIFNCVYCGKGGENTISPTRSIPITKLMDLAITAKRLGVKKIRLTGGEPLIHPEFGDMLRFLSEQGFYVLVNTNGALITKKQNELLRPSSNIHFAVSLDSLDEENFDKISQSKGFFKEVIAGIKVLYDLGLLMRINMVVGRFNLHEIPKMIDFCSELNCDLKLQEISSVPYPNQDWEKIHVNLLDVETILERKADKILLHDYASAYGIPVKVFKIKNVHITVKSLAHGSHFDIGGICKSCPHYPCQEGLYDIYVLGDGSIAPCRWRRFGSWNTFEKDLKYTLDQFRKAEHIKEYNPKPIYRICEKEYQKGVALNGL